MDRGAQQATVHRVTKSRAHLNQLSLHRHTYLYLFLYKFFLHFCCYRISSRVSCGFVVGPCWLSILYIVVSIYMLIPNYQFIPLPQLAIWLPSAWLLCRCGFDVLQGRQFNRFKSSYFSIVALVAYAFGVTYIKSLLRPIFTTSPGCFLLVDLEFQNLHLHL